GFEVRAVDANDSIDVLYPLLELSYGHSRVPLADRSVSHAASRELRPHNRVQLLGVYHEGEPLAMDMMLLYKDRAYFWYGGLRGNHAAPACSVLRWHRLQRAQ